MLIEGGFEGRHNNFLHSIQRINRYCFLLYNISIFLKKVAWNFYDDKKNTADSFTKEEQETWNSQQKKKSSSPLDGK